MDCNLSTRYNEHDAIKEDRCFNYSLSGSGELPGFLSFDIVFLVEIGIRISFERLTKRTRGRSIPNPAHRTKRGL